MLELVEQRRCVGRPRGLVGACGFGLGAADRRRHVAEPVAQPHQREPRMQFGALHPVDGGEHQGRIRGDVRKRPRVRGWRLVHRPVAC